MSDDTYHHEVYGGIIHAANDGTYVMHATGTAGLAAMILAFSLASLSSGALPKWLGWFGIIAAVAALASIAFFTMFVWLLWIVITSLLLFARSRRGDTLVASQDSGRCGDRCDRRNRGRLISRRDHAPDEVAVQRDAEASECSGGKGRVSGRKESQFERNTRQAEDADSGLGEHRNSTRQIVPRDQASGHRSKRERARQAIGLGCCCARIGGAMPARAPRRGARCGSSAVRGV
jgi:hypothetical protein